MAAIASRSPAFTSAYAAGKVTYIGRVTENEDISHVVFRVDGDVAGAPLSLVDVMSIKGYQGSLRFLLTAEIDQFAMLMERAAAQMKQLPGAPPTRQ